MFGSIPRATPTLTVGFRSSTAEMHRSRGFKIAPHAVGDGVGFVHIANWQHADALPFAADAAEHDISLPSALVVLLGESAQKHGVAQRVTEAVV